MAPALKSGADMRMKKYRWFSMRNGLVLQQVAGSLMLLLLTGLSSSGLRGPATSNSVSTFGIST